MEAWRRQRERQAQFIDLLLGAREQLRDLYASKIPVAEMRDHKQQILGRLKFDYTQLRAQWNGFTGYDWWFDRALGNAHLVSAATYHGCVPGFQRVLASVGGDLPKFYEEVRRLSKMGKEEREKEVCGEEAASH